MFSHKVMSSEDMQEVILLKLLAINPKAEAYKERLLGLWERKAIAQALDYVDAVIANDEEPCPDTEPYTSRSPGQISHV